jgi:hypothetical protein
MRKPLVVALLGALGLVSSFAYPGSATAGWCAKRSAASLAALSIKWESLPRVSPVDADKPTLTGEGVETNVEEAAEPKREASDKPFIVLVGEQGGGDEMDKLENVVFKDERIAIGSRAFRAVRITPEEASNDPLLAKHGKESVRLLFISADYTKVTVLEKNKLSVGSTWDAMKATAGKFYAKSLDTTVKDMRDVMLEFDKIDAERTLLRTKEEKLKEKKGSDGDLKEVSEKLAALDERQQKNEAKEKTLWELKPKAAW